MKSFAIKIAQRAMNWGPARALVLSLPLRLRVFLRGFLDQSVGDASNEEDISLVKFLEERIREEASNTGQVIFSSASAIEPKFGSLAIEPRQGSNPPKKVTLDFWDTLVGRVVPAESIKMSASTELSMQLWRLRGFAGSRILTRSLYEARLVSETRQVHAEGEANLRRTLEDLLKGHDSLDARLLIHLERYEVELEKRRARWLGLEEHLPGISIFECDIVSDFYMSSESLAEVASSVAPNPLNGKVITSASLGDTKRDNGKLFRKLEGYPFSEGWLHVGDSEWSDVKCAEGCGAETALVLRRPDSSWNEHNPNEKSLVSDLKHHFGLSDDSLVSLHMASIGYALGSFALETALEKNKKQLVFLSREGEVLAEIYKACSTLFDRLGLPEVDVKVLPVSRKSVFFPSWADDIEQGLLNLAKEHPLTTLDGLISSFGESPEIARALRTEYTKLERIRTGSVWKRISEKSRDVIQREMANQRELIIAYLAQEKIDLEGAIVCDLGWRGTIQDSLSRICGEPVSGAYFGLFNSTSQSHNPKFGLAFDEPRKIGAPEWFNFLGPVERAFTFGSNSAARFSFKAEKVELVLSSESDGANTDRILHFRKNLPELISGVEGSIFALGLFGRETRNYARAILESWMQSPTSHHSAIWFDEIHSEGFGTTMDEVHYKKLVPSSAWFTGSRRRDIKEALTTSRWGQGYIMWSPVRGLWDNDWGRNNA